MCMDIALEFKQSDDFENAFMCPVYDGQDSVMKSYTEHILTTKVLDSKLKIK